MNEKNLNLIVENKESFETVQEVENTWEGQLENQEQELLHQLERTDEEGFYVAEAVGAENSISNLAHQPSSQPQQSKVTIDPQTNKPVFLFKISLEQCYFTYDSFWTTALWRDGKKNIKKITFEKVEEAEDLLQQLENNKVRMVDDLWGWESGTNTKTKNRLKEELNQAITSHQEGRIVVKYFNDEPEWYQYE